MAVSFRGRLLVGKVETWKPQTIWVLYNLCRSLTSFSKKSTFFSFPALCCSVCFFVPFLGGYSTGIQSWCKKSSVVIFAKMTAAGAKYWTFDVLLSSWWFQIFFIFTPWGRFPIWLYDIFKTAWNHQPANLWVVFLGETEKKWCFPNLELRKCIHPRNSPAESWGFKKTWDSFGWTYHVRVSDLFEMIITPMKINEFPLKVNGWKM